MSEFVMGSELKARVLASVEFKHFNFGLVGKCIELQVEFQEDYFKRLVAHLSAGIAGPANRLSCKDAWSIRWLWLNVYRFEAGESPEMFVKRVGELNHSTLPVEVTELTAANWRCIKSGVVSWRHEK